MFVLNVGFRGAGVASWRADRPTRRPAGGRGARRLRRRRDGRAASHRRARGHQQAARQGARRRARGARSVRSLCLPLKTAGGRGARRVRRRRDGRTARHRRASGSPRCPSSTTAQNCKLKMG